MFDLSRSHLQELKSRVDDSDQSWNDLEDVARDLISFAETALNQLDAARRLSGFDDREEN